MRDRQSDRYALNMQAACRVPANPVAAIILDLSVTGCRGRSECVQLNRGATILLTLASGDEMAGQVVWADREEFGVRFFEPVSAAIVTRLSAEQLS